MLRRFPTAELLRRLPTISDDLLPHLHHNGCWIDDGCCSSLVGRPSSLVAVVPQTAFLVLLTGFYKATCTKTLAKNHRKVRCNSCSILHDNKWGQVKPTKFKRQFQSIITTWICPRCVTKSLLAELPMAGIGNTSCESLWLDEGEVKVRMYGEVFDSSQLSELAASELPDCEGIVVDQTAWP